MSKPYLCPACRNNRQEFELIFKLSQEIRKDDMSGKVLYRGDELTTLTQIDGRPDLDIRCGRCQYVGSESSFTKAAQ